MQPAHPHILTINGGSSSMKFALHQVGEPLARRFYGQADRLGLIGTKRKRAPSPCPST
jgi:acetate kinase